MLFKCNSFIVFNKFISMFLSLKAPAIGLTIIWESDKGTILTGIQYSWIRTSFYFKLTPIRVTFTGLTDYPVNNAHSVIPIINFAQLCSHLSITDSRVHTIMT